MKITVMGAGAVGGFFGAKLAAAGHDVLFVARGPHLSAMRDRGLDVATPKGPLRFRTRAADHPEDADLILFAVKTYDTPEAADACRPVRGDVLTLQNGLGHEEILLERLGDRVVGGVAYVAAEVTAPGRIALTGGGRIVAGEFDGTMSERIARIKQTFDAADAPCEATDQIRRAMWEKLVANAVFNVISAAHGIELREILTPAYRAQADQAVAEIVTVAGAYGIEIRPEAKQGPFLFCERHPTFKTSTQQDVARGRQTEVESLTGAVLRYARGRGISVPTIALLDDRLRQRSRLADL